jgi:hypothetical protein
VQYLFFPFSEALRVGGMGTAWKKNKKWAGKRKVLGIFQRVKIGRDEPQKYFLQNLFFVAQTPKK